MFGFGKKYKEPLDTSDLEARVKFLEETAERLNKNINILADRFDQEEKQWESDHNSMVERVSTLETKVANLDTIIAAVANLDTIITAVAEGFNKAMEELEDV